MAENPDKTPVANDIFTYCTKEKIDTWHVVRNHNANGIVDRVVCKACKSEHKYRSQALAAVSGGAKKVAVKRVAGGPLGRPKAVAAPTKSLEEIWFSGVKKWGTKEVNPFDSNYHYKAGEVFDHASFGKGVVQLRRENKIDVLFASNVQKTLISK